MADSALPGIVVRAFGKWFAVQLRDEPRQLLSTVKGAVRRERLRTDLVAVGDRVWVTDVGDDEGRIEAVEPRTSVLSRLARRTQDVEQVILANPDQALFLFAIRHPEPHLRMLDRFLVLAESRGLPAIIGVNKLDLDDGEPGEAEDAARRLFADYEAIYPVVYLSVRDGRHIDDLLERLRGKVTVVAGPSGAGKSSLLNRLDPGREREVGAISDATGKGRHTTTQAELYRIEPGTFVADTPGIRALAIHGVPPEELDRCYPELRPCLGRCFYANCTHVHEPGCAVIDAVEAGAISRARYESYVSLRRGETAEE
ncbi:MAG: ribosome small subunit-dependent GTPase A [Thermomicrobiales bacterium]|nr:ribosome small subunit-dependent GTPase A [Thermomicrobiales bacterium]